MHQDSDESQRRERDLQRQAARPQVNLANELLALLMHNKKWWLTPIFVVLLLLGVLIAIGGTGAAPFLYPLF